MHESILIYQRGFYFKVAVIVTLAAFALYFTQGEGEPPNGGTWQGYVLGSVATLLIIWLLLLGARKRSYYSRASTLQAWTSAHIYLGMALVPVATLHAGAQLGWNVHSLAYYLMLAVVLSGLAGLYFYTAVPGRIAHNLSGQSRDALAAELAEVNEEAIAIAKNCDTDVFVMVESAVQRTTTPTGFWSQLCGVDQSVCSLRGGDESHMQSKLVANKDQQTLVDFISGRIPSGIRTREAAYLQELLSVCSRRQQLLRSLRRDVQYRACLKAWLVFHIPLSYGLLAALMGHILSVFIYW